jgi:4-amino-4-deoxy-L-arabinose transferase-like glycosyltransferase
MIFIHHSLCVGNSYLAIIIPMAKDSFSRRFLNLFRHDNKISYIIITLAVVINLIVLTNAILHHPKIGYDVGENLNYIQILMQRLPTEQDTYEFFSPPLPYFLPSLFDIACAHYTPASTEIYNGIHYSEACRTYDGKFAQIINFLLSIGATILLLRIAEQIKPGNRFFKLSMLSMLALLTVYYKTFSQVRGEPYVVFFILLAIYLIHQLLNTTTFSYKLVIAIGITLGLLVLSRQWGFFIFPAIFLLILWIFVQDRRLGWLRARQFFFITLLSALVGGWFYIHLYVDYGTFSAFNIKQPTYPSTEQAISFFRETELKDWKLFDKPIRPAFDHQSFFAIMYSETWGDYWGYFTFIKPGSAPDRIGNQASIASYLGKVNLFSVLPSILLLAAFIFGFIQLFQWRQPPTVERMDLVFITLLALSTIGGYLWFVYRYFLQVNDVVKATYTIQFYIALLFLLAGLMEAVRIKSQWAYNLILILLTIVFIHNLPAMITRYNVYLGF